jgi:hypothetical protein
VVIAALIVLLLPGIAWLVLFWEGEQDPLEQLAGVIGSSIALTAIIVLGFFLTGWEISASSLVGIYVMLFLVFIGGLAVRTLFRAQANKITPAGVGQQTGSEEGIPPPRRSRQWIRLAVPGIFLCLIVAMRVYQVRELVLPAWVDSVHHVLIVRIFLENHGLPATLEPYLPAPFYYHYSFHALSAAFAAIGRVLPHQSVLWIGQILNAAVALSVYRLGKALWGDWRRAGLSMLLIGFVAQMPAYYATWGRYTLLTGLLLLPLAMAVTQDINHKGASRSRLATLALLTAGLLLSHYFAALLFALFLVLCIGQSVLKGLRTGQRLENKKWPLLVYGGAIGVLLAAPWLYRMWGYAQSDVSVGAVSFSKQAMEDTYYPGYLSYLLYLLGPRRNTIFLILALGGLPLAIRRGETRVFALWAILLGIMSLPWGIYLAPFRPDHATIILFLPAALLLADLMLTAIDWLGGTRFSRIAVPAVWVLIAALIAWGIWDTRKIINESTVLARPEDMQAISWIEANIPITARFLINTTHWQDGSYRGIDGGWWIEPLTGRETLLPAVLYLMGDTEYVHQVNEYALEASELQGCSGAFWDLVNAAGVTHVYLNQGKGSLKAEDLQNCPNLELVYQASGVSIFQILDQKPSVHFNRNQFHVL